MVKRSENVAFQYPSGNPAPWVLIAGGFHYFGGMDKANAALAAYLLQRKTPLYLVAHEVDPEFLKRPEVRVHLVPRPAGSVLIGEWLLNRCGQAVAREVLGRYPRARVLVNGGNCVWPDINWVHYVHSAWSGTNDDAPAWFTFKNRMSCLLGRRCEQSAIGAARVVLANSERTRSDLINHLCLRDERIHTVYLGSDPTWGPATPRERASSRAWLGEPPGRPIVLFAGALGHDERKGFDILWSAWRALCSQSNWDADLVVAGGGRGLAKWKLKTAQSGLDSRIRFLGFTDRIQEILAAVDLLVSPVRYEAYGLNVQEAICRGVPALVSRCAGVAERYPADLTPMLLPDPSDVDDLTGRLLNWRSNIAYWKDRVATLATVLRTYTWVDMARRMVSIAETEHARLRDGHTDIFGKTSPW
jgi:glycosyltransferase involved in cell wall biosynthesis